MRNRNRTGRLVPFRQDGAFFHRRADRHMNSNNLYDALYNYRLAADYEPDNLDYRMDLATLFSEMGFFEASNEILFDISARSRDYATSCLFGMGCNFMGLMEYDKAQVNFEQYLRQEPDGEYAEDVEEMLDFLAEQPAAAGVSRQKNRVRRLADLGKTALDSGDFSRAVWYLERADQRDEKLIYVKNNLSLAYFYVGRRREAETLAKRMLLMAPDNVHALCNLSAFRAARGQACEELIARATEAAQDDPDAMLKLCVTLAELERHAEVRSCAEQLVHYRPFDQRLLYMLGAANYRLGNYEEAVQWWNKVEKLFPYNPVLDYCRTCAYAAKKGEEPGPVLYVMALPQPETTRRLAELGGLVYDSGDLGRAHWRDDERYRALLAWALSLRERTVQRMVLNLLVTYADRRAEYLLRQFLLHKEEPDSLKREVIGMLRLIGAAQPYIAYIDNNLVEARVNRNQAEGERPLREVYRLIRRHSGRKTKEQLRGLKRLLVALYAQYPPGRDVDAWAAAAQTLWEGSSQADLANRYGVSPRLIRHLAEKMTMAMEGNNAAD